MSTATQDIYDLANIFRIQSIEMVEVTAAGHPTSCASMAELIATVFFHPEVGMRFDPQDPRALTNDKFVLSKGHAAPILYCAQAHAGSFPKEDLMKLRTIGSDLEGHPTPRLPFIDFATGSLGQGLNNACGVAYSMKYFEKRDARVYTLCGDGELAEGSNWEALHFASLYKLNNYVVILDANRLGQSMPTSLEHHLEIYEARAKAFGFHTLVIDGHNVEEIVAALKTVETQTDKPTFIVAKTFKGKGCIEGIEDSPVWHGKPFGGKSKATIDHIKAQIKNPAVHLVPRSPVKEEIKEEVITHTVGELTYTQGQMISTRLAFGNILKKMGDKDKRIIGVDADVKNSTFSCKLKEAHPDQFIDCYIAEQNMVGVSVGVSKRQRIPFASTFATFFTRAADHIRMGVVSQANVKYVGTHVGISIGTDGPSQMGLEDISLFRGLPHALVFYPTDAIAMEHAMVHAVNYNGPVFIRTNRPDTPIIYDNHETFAIGDNKIVKRNPAAQITIIAAGVTLNEALFAVETLAAEGIHVNLIDLFCVKPINPENIRNLATQTNNTILVVEDHYPEGGLTDAVRGAVSTDGFKIHQLAVMDVPRSGQP